MQQKMINKTNLKVMQLKLQLIRATRRELIMSHQKPTSHYSIIDPSFILRKHPPLIKSNEVVGLFDFVNG